MYSKAHGEIEVNAPCLESGTNLIRQHLDISSSRRHFRHRNPPSLAQRLRTDPTAFPSRRSLSDRSKPHDRNSICATISIPDRGRTQSGPGARRSVCGGRAFQRAVLPGNQFLGQRGGYDRLGGPRKGL